MSRVMKISEEEWLAELCKIDKPKDGYITTYNLAKKLNRSETYARQIIRKAVDRKMLEPRQITATNMAGRPCKVIVYYPAGK